MNASLLFGSFNVFSCPFIRLTAILSIAQNVCVMTQLIEKATYVISKLDHSSASHLFLRLACNEIEQR